jgi:hypothetical protein
VVGADSQRRAPNVSVFSLMDQLLRTRYCPEHAHRELAIIRLMLKNIRADPSDDDLELLALSLMDLRATVESMRSAVTHYQETGKRA